MCDRARRRSPGAFAQSPFLAFLLLALPVNGAERRWFPLGPEGGTVYTVWVDPNAPDHVLAGTYYGGPFETVSGGSTWSPINSGLGDTRVFALLDCGAGTFAGTPSGVYRRFAGPYWSQASSGLTTKFVYTLAVDWSAGNRLFAGTDGGGVFRSSDQGASWKPINNELGNLTVRTLVLDVNLGTLFAGTLGGGAFRAGSLGEANPLWEPINAGLDNQRVNALLLLSGSLLLAGTDDGVFRSTDRGLHWRRASSGLATRRVTWLDGDLTQSSVAYAATKDGVFKTLDGGDTWSPASSGLPPIGATCVRVAPSNPAVIYAGSYVGVYRSADAAATWLPVTRDLWDADILAMAVDPSATSTVLIAQLGAGILRTTDAQPRWDIAVSPPRWSFADTGLTDLVVTALIAEPGPPSMFYAGAASGVFVSNDAGTSWRRSSDGLSTSAVNCLVADPKVPGTVYAGTAGDGVFKTTNASADWVRVGTGLANPNVFALAVDPLITATLYAGTEDGIFKTTDGGSHWTAASTGLTNRSVMALAVDPASPLTVYAGTYGDAVFRSADGGASWAPSGNGITSGQVMSLAIVPGNPPVLLAGTWGGGVFISTDNGATWAPHTTDMRERHVASLLVAATAANMVLAGTCGGLYAGVFGACQMACGVRAPSSVAPGAAFTLWGPEISPSGCLGTVSYDWDFGDGSPHATTASGSHAYANPGTYLWRFTATAGSTVCKQSGSITVASGRRVRRHLGGR